MHSARWWLRCIVLRRNNQLLKTIKLSNKKSETKCRVLNLSGIFWIIVLLCNTCRTRRCWLANVCVWGVGFWRRWTGLRSTDQSFACWSHQMEHSKWWRFHVRARALRGRGSWRRRGSRGYGWSWWVRLHGIRSSVDLDKVKVFNTKFVDTWNVTIVGGL